MGCAASSGQPPPDGAAWAATGALGITGRAADAPSMRHTRWTPAVSEPIAELEPEPEALTAQLKLSDLEELCILGVGSFGVVRLVRHRPDGKTYGEKTSPRHQSATVAYPVGGIGGGENALVTSESRSAHTCVASDVAAGVGCSAQVLSQGSHS